MENFALLCVLPGLCASSGYHRVSPPWPRLLFWLLVLGLLFREAPSLVLVCHGAYCHPFFKHHDQSALRGKFKGRFQAAQSIGRRFLPPSRWPCSLREAPKSSRENHINASSNAGGVAFCGFALGLGAQGRLAGASLIASLVASLVARWLAASRRRPATLPRSGAGRRRS